MKKNRNDKPIEERLLELLGSPHYQPLKPKALARELGVSTDEYGEFRQTLKELVRKGKLEVARKSALRLAQARGQVVGVFRSLRAGGGFVRPRAGQGSPLGDVYVKAKHARDAVSGDVVLVSVVRSARGDRAAEGKIDEVIERASETFVGHYFTAGDEAFVRVDGGMFPEPIYVGDPGVKGAKDGDQVVLEMLRFPSPEFAGEGVVVEVLGRRGDPGVDLLSIIREFHLPDAFSADALAQAREQARVHDTDAVPRDRLDLTAATIITIDPIDARDFDDAINLDRDEKGFWRLGVHIADVATFVPEGSTLDHEAKARGTSVYLPGRVIPMLPELISNGLASLQEGRLRLTKSVFIEFDPEGRITHTELANSAIRVKRRFTYEEVMAYFEDPAKGGAGIEPTHRTLLDQARELARILRERRRAKGMLELSMPEIELDYDAQGKISGAHYAPNDESHQLIEEFMVTANEVVAETLTRKGAKFLRRVHELPDPYKLRGYAEFLKSLGLKIEDPLSRFELQKVLSNSADQPHRHAVHYAMLRSLKQAVYSPDEEVHFALASEAYCHFTSPIRRYPDLTIHRMVDDLVRRGKAGADPAALVVLGEHCSFTERRAEKAERELIKVKLLDHLAHRIGTEWDMVITGVEEFGFFAMGVDFPIEGMVHVSALGPDYYTLDRATHSLVGRARGKRYRLGDAVRCVLWRVDVDHRQMQLRLAESAEQRVGRPEKLIRSPEGNGVPAIPVRGKKKRSGPKGRKKKRR